MQFPKLRSTLRFNLLEVAQNNCYMLLYTTTLSKHTVLNKGKEVQHSYTLTR